MILKDLFQEKNRLLKYFLEQSKNFASRLDNAIEAEKKLIWIDELSELRESSLKLMRVLDQKIDLEKQLLSSPSVKKLQGDIEFENTLFKTIALVKEIQLTDQALFLYIKSMGSELRVQIVRSLKEKEAVSKFKSQTHSLTGDELDQTV